VADRDGHRPRDRVRRRRRAAAVARFATARQPDTVAVDPTDGRVFVADATAGTVEMIEPGR
jgi:hypothetical protein